MALLLIFAFVAGAGTAITPCVLPVLPALLSAGATGGRRRPLGLVAGLLVTFTIAVAALASLVQGVGLADGAARTVAVVVLIAFGMAPISAEFPAFSPARGSVSAGRFMRQAIIRGRFLARRWAFEGPVGSEHRGCESSATGSSQQGRASVLRRGD